MRGGGGLAPTPLPAALIGRLAVILCVVIDEVMAAILGVVTDGAIAAILGVVMGDGAGMPVAG